MRKEKLTPEEQATAELCLGRILRMGSRPSQPGDVEEYERCRNLFLDTVNGKGL